jgi:hypothetical protein
MRRKGMAPVYIGGLVVIVALIIFAGYAALSGFGRPGPSTGTTSSISVTSTQRLFDTSSFASTNSSSIQTQTCGVNFPSESDVCATLLSNQDFQQLLNQSSSVYHEDGVIVMQIGYGDCINYFYFLSNSTLVQLQSGAQNTTSSCA